MKMSDVFQLPVEPDSDNDIKVGDWGFLLASEDVTSEQASAAANAINCHDGLVDAVEVLLLHAELADRQAISELLARAKGVL